MTFGLSTLAEGICPRSRGEKGAPCTAWGFPSGTESPALGQIASIQVPSVGTLMKATCIYAVPPPGKKAIDAALGITEYRVPSKKGIEFEGLFYNSDDLAQIRALPECDGQIAFIVDPNGAQAR